MTRRGLLVVAVGGLGAAIWTALPPAARHVDLPADSRLAVGALHVHTRRSDGAGTIDDVARAAAVAGLQFVVVSDHGDGTRPVESPAWRHGVLVVDAVEISTSAGHYIALGLGEAPYRLAGEARDVIEDVHRLGGFGFAAHPDSAKPDLEWRAWDTAIDGLEWLNADSEWRDEAPAALARALLSYWLRAPETIAMVFDRPAENLARWDSLTRRRPVVGIAGHDAHARIGARGNWEPADEDWSLHAPSYEAAFRAFAVRVVLSQPLLSDDADTSSRILLDGLRSGHAFTVIDAVAGPARLEFTARASDGSHFQQGDRIPGGLQVTLAARIHPAVDGARIRLLRNGDDWRESGEGELHGEHDGGRAATYRVEVHLPGAPGEPPVPWIVSNPIYVGLSDSGDEPAAGNSPDVRQRPVMTPDRKPGWRLEHHPTSTATVGREFARAGEPWWRFGWTLAEGRRAGQYAALVAPVPPGVLAGIDRLVFRARASRPMRLSVQVRVPDGEGLRWQRSVYLDRQTREVSIPLDQMRAIEPPPGTAIESGRVDSLLFVVDTVNTPPGRSGVVWLTDVRWEGSGPAS